MNTSAISLKRGGHRFAVAVAVVVVVAIATVSSASPASPAPATTGPVSISAGLFHTCAVRSGGTLACWGYNSLGQASPPAGTFTEVTAGEDHSCGVRTDGTVTCWGSNGLGKASPPAGTFTQVTVGAFHSCGLRSGGTVACWGYNGLGQASPPAGTFTQVTAGSVHSCGVRTDGSVTCWGYNGLGQASPPAGTFTQVTAGGDHSCGVRTDGTVACWGDNSIGQASPPVGTFTQVSSGSSHSCGVRTDGTATCWGYNSNGQASPPAGTFTQVSTGTFHSCGVRTDGTITCWGPHPDGAATPLVTSAAPGPGSVGAAYSHTFTTTFMAPAATFTVLSGALPPGLSLTPAGVLAGTPTAAGTIGPITVEATNGLAPIATQTFTFEIAQAASTTVLSSSASPSTYGDPVTFTATVSSDGGTPTGAMTITGCGPIALDATGLAACTPPPLAAGNYAVTAAYGGDTNFEASADELAQAVDPAPLTVQAPSPAKTYGQPVPALPPSYAGLVNGDVAPATPAICSTGATATSPAGTYPVSCSGGADANYAIANVDGTLTVTPAVLTVTADTRSRPFAAANPPLTATYTGFVLGETLPTSDVTGAPACTTTATPTSPPGVYAITCTAGTLASTNYTLTFEPGSLTITKAPTALVARPATVVRSLLTLRVTFAAALTSTATGTPIPGQTVTFALAGSSCSAPTAADGVARCSVSILNILAVLLGRPYTATYAGNATYQPSSTTGPVGLL